MPTAYETERQEHAEYERLALTEYRDYQSKLQEISDLVIDYLGEDELNEAQYEALNRKILELVGRTDVLLKKRQESDPTDFNGTLARLDFFRSQLKSKLMTISQVPVRLNSGATFEFGMARQYEFVRQVLEFRQRQAIYDSTNDPQTLRELQRDALILEVEAIRTQSPQLIYVAKRLKEREVPNPNIDISLSNEEKAGFKILVGDNFLITNPVVFKTLWEKISGFNPIALDETQRETLRELRSRLLYHKDHIDMLVSAGLTDVEYFAQKGITGLTPEKFTEVLNATTQILERDAGTGTERPTVEAWKQFINNIRVEDGLNDSYLREYLAHLEQLDSTGFDRIAPDQLQAKLYALQQLSRTLREQEQFLRDNPSNPSSMTPADNAAVLAYIYSIRDEIGRYHAKIEAAINGTASETTTTDPWKLTTSEILNLDIEKINNSELLLMYGKKLFKEMANITKMPTSPDDDMVALRTVYDKIINRLNGIKTNESEKMGAYLKDRVELHAADFLASADLAVNTKTMFEGGHGWLGIITFNHENILRLLYGSEIFLPNSSDDLLDMDINRTLTGYAAENQFRTVFVTQALRVMSELLSDYDPATGRKGKFHATQKFDTALIRSYKNEVRDEVSSWLLDRGHVFSDQENVLLEEALSQAHSLATVLNMRIYHALPFYEGGWSPADEIGKNISHFAGLNGAKLVYEAIGKKTQDKHASLICRELERRRPSERMKNSLADDKSRLYEEYQAFTAINQELRAPSLDEGVSDAEKIAYQIDKDCNQFPALVEVFWSHKMEGRRIGEKKHLTQSFANAISGLDRSTTLNDYNTAMQNLEKFIEKTENKFVPNLDGAVSQYEDLIAEVVNLFSPIKAFPGVDFRYVANRIYVLLRDSLLRLHSENQDNPSLPHVFSKVLNTVHGGLSAETMKQPISGIPRAFIARYNLPTVPGTTDKVYMRDYLTALLPEAELQLVRTTLTDDGDKRKNHKEILAYHTKFHPSNSVVRTIQHSIQFNPGRYRLNGHILEELSGEPVPLAERASAKFNDMLRRIFYRQKASTTLRELQSGSSRIVSNEISHKSWESFIIQNFDYRQDAKGK